MNTPITIGVLVPSDGHQPTAPPETRPIGRAALMLAADGIDVIFGDTVMDGRMTGFRATASGWEPVADLKIDGAHDRFPSQLRANRYQEIQAGLGSVPMANPLAFTMLCRDKLKSQLTLAALGVPMPEVVSDPSEFTDALTAWGAGFLKPRFGALGIGVQRVLPGDALPSELTGVVPDRPDPSLLQRAIIAPDGWASRTVRVLLQRTPNGGWASGTPVVRSSRTDPVANAARGAEVAAGPAVLPTAVLKRIADATHPIIKAFEQLEDSDWVLEAGVDLVLDEDHQPWLVEINSRPRGRMEVLAATDPDRYRQAHIAAAARPIARIAALINR